MKSFLIFPTVFFAASLLLPVQADLVPLLQYSFPASYDGSVNDVQDQSIANNDATVNQGHPLALSTLVPVGEPALARSIDFNATFGNINTVGTSLLNNPAIQAAGGFTVDLWFNPTGAMSGTGVRKIFDYAGTTNIRYDDVGVSEVSINLGGVVAFNASQGLNTNDWNHVILEFDTVGNALGGDGSISGVGTFVLNGNTFDLGPRTITNAGDLLNRPISFGRHPTAASEHYRGLLYNPSVFLGVAVPEPGTLALFLLGGLSLMRMRKIM